MEQEKNNKGVIALLVVLVVILVVLCILLATGKLSLKSNESTTENNVQGITNIESLNNQVKITNLSIEKPSASAFGGSENNMLAVPVSFDLNCSNSSLIAGVTLKGYCLDTNDNKYSIVGPLSIMAYYCDSDEKKISMYVNQTYDKDGIPHEFDWKPTNKWDNIDIKYCKIEKANVRLSDASEIVTGIDINYEKEFN